MCQCLKRRLSLVAEHLSCKQKVKGSIPLIAFFSSESRNLVVSGVSSKTIKCHRKRSVSVTGSGCVWKERRWDQQGKSKGRTEALVVQWYDVSLPRMRPGFDSRQAHFSYCQERNQKKLQVVRRRGLCIRRLSLVVEHLSCKQKVKGSIPLIAFFSSPSHYLVVSSVSKVGIKSQRKRSASESRAV